jgi:hypothetical protein
MAATHWTTISYGADARIIAALGGRSAGFWYLLPSYTRCWCAGQWPVAPVGKGGGLVWTWWVLDQRVSLS